MVMDRSERGRVGARAQHLIHDAKETTKKARATFLSRFESDEQRRTYFAELARKSVEVRARKRNANQEDTDATARI